MKHLSSEELLLQCDGELGRERSSHLESCSACRAALVDLEARLYEIECRLRASLPPEPIQSRIASWVALEHQLQPPQKVSGFPVRWPAVYAAAAALTFAVLGGYLSSVLTPPDSRVELAQRPSLPPLAEVTAPAPELTAPAPPSETARPRANSGPPPVLGSVATPAAVNAEIERPPATDAVILAEPERFEVPISTQSIQANVRLATLPTPDLTAALPVVPMTAHYETVFTVPLATIPEPTRPEPASAEAAEAMIDGYWILAQAEAWREDIEPVWTPDGLHFDGSVEDSTAQRRLEAAIVKEAGYRNVTVNLRSRRHTESPQLAGTGAPTIIAAVDRRPAGGAVRHTLLAHFSDAARRSFQSPQPSVLDAELDRFVSEVFRSQSQLLSHAYALKRLLSVDGRLDVLEPASRKKFVELTRFHMNAVGEHEARIYDRLSETLPRRFWSYRPSERDLVTEDDWQAEGASLLRDTLRLDSTLTALLSTPQSTIDASEPGLSCGELLHRIRTRVRHLKTGADALR